MAQEGPSYHELMIAGLGGRGVIMAGQLLVEAGLSTYEHVLMFPNYSGAMRGTDSECTVILSNEKIRSPVILNPEVVMVMSASVLKSFEERVRPGGMIIVDSTLIPDKAGRDDVRAFYVLATKVAQELGSALAANLVLLGAYAEATKAVPLEALEGAVERMMAGGRREHLMPINIKALIEGARIVANYK